MAELEDWANYIGVSVPTEIIGVCSIHSLHHYCDRGIHLRFGHIDELIRQFTNYVIDLARRGELSPDSEAAFIEGFIG